MPRPDVLKDLQAVCDLRVPAKPLILPVMDPLATCLAGVSYSDYSTKAVIMEDVWSNVIQLFDLDWAAPFVDDLFEFEPLGIKVVNSAELPFAVSEYLPATFDTLHSLRLPAPQLEGRMPMFLEAITRLRNRWEDSILIAGSVAAPFSGLTLLYGIEQTMLMLYDDPDLLNQSMTFLADLAVTWAAAMIKEGANVIWVGDCSASSRFLPLEIYKNLCLNPAKKVVDAVRQMGATTIYHAGENRLPYLSAMADTGADLLSVEAGIEMGTVKDAVGDRCGLIGNMDSINLLWHGTPEQIESEVTRLVTEVASRGGYIVNMGENTPEQTPSENLEAMIRSLREAWGKFLT